MPHDQVAKFFLQSTVCVSRISKAKYWGGGGGGGEKDREEENKQQEQRGWGGRSNGTTLGSIPESKRHLVGILVNKYMYMYSRKQINVPVP